jgi:hypothetical protein
MLQNATKVFLMFSYSAAVMKSRKMEWAGHIAHMEAIRNVYFFFSGKAVVNSTRKTWGMDGRIILKWML